MGLQLEAVARYNFSRKVVLMPKVNVYLPEDQLRKVDDAARTLGLSRSKALQLGAAHVIQMAHIEQKKALFRQKKREILSRLRRTAEEARTELWNAQASLRETREQQ